MTAGKKLGMAVAAVSLAALVSTAPAADLNQEKGNSRVKPGNATWLNPQPEPPIGRITAQTRAWLHGIPGDTTPGGIPVEISSHPGDKRARFTIRANAEAMAKIKALHERKARVNLKLVIRQNPGDKQDTAYDLGDAKIESIRGDGAQTSSINMSFDRMSKVAGLGFNPGVPPRTPAILSAGINKGWIHFAETKDPNGVPVDVIGYTEPEATGQMRLAFEGGESLQAILKEFHRVKKDVDMLILMLPDVKTGKYVEYKLAKASIGSLADVGSNRHEAVFNSDVIECLTGVNAE